jgi:hypothetical protein
MADVALFSRNEVVKRFPLVRFMGTIPTHAAASFSSVLAEEKRSVLEGYHCYEYSMQILLGDFNARLGKKYFCCLNDLNSVSSMSLRSEFRNRSFLFKHTKDFVSVFRNSLEPRI